MIVHYIDKPWVGSKPGVGAGFEFDPVRRFPDAITTPVIIEANPGLTFFSEVDGATVVGSYVGILLIGVDDRATRRISPGDETLPRFILKSQRKGPSFVLHTLGIWADSDKVRAGFVIPDDPTYFLPISSGTFTEALAMSESEIIAA